MKNPAAGSVTIPKSKMVPKTTKFLSIPDKTSFFGKGGQVTKFEVDSFGGIIEGRAGENLHLGIWKH